MIPTLTSRPIKRLTLYVPERDRFNDPVPNLQPWIDEAIILLCSFGGGVTCLPLSDGAWLVEDTGTLVREKLHILYCDVDPERYVPMRLIDFMLRFGETTGQDAVAAEYDGELKILKIIHKPAS